MDDRSESVSELVSQLWGKLMTTGNYASAAQVGVIGYEFAVGQGDAELQDQDHALALVAKAAAELKSNKIGSRS